MIPEVSSLIDDLQLFIEENSGPAKIIENVKASIADHIFVAENFLPDDATIGRLDFELRDTSLVAATPIFNGFYHFEITAVPDSHKPECSCAILKGRNNNG